MRWLVSEFGVGSCLDLVVEVTEAVSVLVVVVVVILG